MMKKQILLLAMMLLPFAANADDSGSCGENVTYTFNEATGTLVISGTGAMTDFDSNDTPWYSYRESIQTVEMKDGLTSIGHLAFAFCSNLTSITIPSSVTSIGNGVFWNCQSLTYITIPNSVTNIGNGAFSGCFSLTSVTIPNSVTSIGGSAFYGCI